MLAYSMSSIWYTLFVCMCLYCVSWWCCLGTSHLSGSWSLTVQDYMLDWLGDVTSTVGFCQLSGDVCYPTNLCSDCRLHMDLCWTYEVCNYAFCIFFEWFSCPCILSVFHVDQYTCSIVPLAYVLVWCYFWICQVLISQWIICQILSVHYVVKCDQCIVTYANHSPLVGIDLHKMGRSLDSSDLIQPHLRDLNNKEWWASENILWQEYVRYGTHFR